jgi:NAD(P)-dependent dehydrogenase (short-subunit alcohol dehydrogenase family)
MLAFPSPFLRLREPYRDRITGRHADPAYYILTRRFALELGQHGITVNAVAPGFVRTDMTQRGRGAADWPGTEERFAARAMMGRNGEPEDIANAVVFLASRASTSPAKVVPFQTEQRRDSLSSP